MSWGKNRFSYLTWFVYTLMTGAALVILGGVICAEEGIRAYWGVLSAVLYSAAVGGLVFWFHRVMRRRSVTVLPKRVLFVFLEAVLVVVLLILGLAFRIHGMEMESGAPSSEYYEAAKVMTGQSIPQTVHGAVYFYVQALHGAFLLFGNSYVIGFWMQIVLQLASFLLLYFTVRKLVGAIAALVVLGFCMCAPYIIEGAFTLSPEPLFFCIFVIAAALMAVCYGKKPGPGAFLFTGVLSAVCVYLDVMGFLLLLLAFAMIFCRREESCAVGRKAEAAVLCLTGGVSGFLICMLLDSLFSGKPFWRIARAWFLLYRPEDFQLPVSAGFADSGAECLVLFGLMTFGIFSFWCDKRAERLSAGVIGVVIVILAGCFGIFTDEMPGYFYLYLLCAVLAGAGLEQCFRVSPAALKEEETNLKTTGKEETGRGTAIGGQKKEAAGEASESESGQEAAAEASEKGMNVLKKEVQFIENPLPLPKKHVKRVMDYSLKSEKEKDDFDYPVKENDDFDI